MISTGRGCDVEPWLLPPRLFLRIFDRVPAVKVLITIIQRIPPNARRETALP